MKPQSIIFLIFSVIIIIFGTLLCSYASKTAEEQGIDLFIQETDSQGNSIIRYTIEETDAESITLNSVATEIHVYEGAEISYLELVNYKINTFAYQQSGSEVTFTDDTSIKTLLNLNGDGTQFLGIRHYKNLANFKAGKQVINLYLSSEFKLDTLNINNVSGTIDVYGCSSVRKYSFKSEKGNITLNNVTEAEVADLTVTENAEVSVISSMITSISASLEAGDFQFVAAQSNTQSYALTTDEGVVIIDGEEYVGEYHLSSAAALVTCQVNTKNGDIIVNDLISEVH